MRRSAARAWPVLMVPMFGALACAGAGPDLAEWTLPVPAGTPLIEYAPVPPTARSHHPQMVEDLILGGSARRGDELLYRPIAVSADEAGNIFVLDAGEPRVVAFDRDGNHLRTFGRPGQGPAELDRPLSLSVVGDHLVVISDNRRLSFWSLDGRHLGDEAPLFGSQTFFSLLGPTANQIVLGYVTRSRRGLATTNVLRVAAFTRDGQEVTRYTELPRRRGILGNAPVARPQPMYANSFDGSVYATGAARYEVLALGPSGEAVWHLRVTTEPEELTPADIDETMAIVHRNRPSVTTGEFQWPERFPALSYIAVDGHGHLWVYPFVRRSERAERPVDVFSPEGERLFTGLSAAPLPWIGRDDFVYSIDQETADGEYRVVRYRLVEPFD